MLGIAMPLAGCTLDNKSIGDEGDSSDSANDDGGMTDDGDDGDDSNDGTETGGGDDGQESGLSTQSGDGPEDGSDDGMLACTLPPLPEGAEDSLSLSCGRLHKVAVGATRLISFGTAGFGGIPEEVEACKEWSVAPADAATIDDEGFLTVNEDTAPGTIVTVTVDVENGRAILTHAVEVYVPNDAAIVGSFNETVRLDCPGYLEFDPTLEQRVNEVVFFDSGDFFVTWQPYETYVDYWGTYTYDNASGLLSMTPTGGNYEPTDADLEGTTTLEGETLRVVDMFFGSSSDGPVTAACGHVLG